MAIDPKWFEWCNEHGVRKGTRVRHTDGREGVVEHIWFGVEESLDVHLDDGSRTTWHPAEGLDPVEVLASG